MSARYRLQQGLRALGAWLRPVEDAEAAQYLTPDLFALYCQMRRSERQHSLRVLRGVLQAGYTHPDVLVAALLHDVGKIRTRFWLWEKVLVVLVKAFFPALYWRWGSGLAQSWRRPFAVSVQHPAWGAEMVAAAGGPPLAVELIRRHQEALIAPPQTETDRLLCALQIVDNQN
ncbi:MAG: HD domain-containing protein [Chloroflexi bacterium]|nr:HD domain-containing protein [Chloroflexota bacterium]